MVESGAHDMRVTLLIDIPDYWQADTCLAMNLLSESFFGKMVEKYKFEDIPSDDCISRQEVIHAINSWADYYDKRDRDSEILIESVLEMGSVKPTGGYAESEE